MQSVILLETEALLMERRKIVPLEKNSPKLAVGSRLILLCLSSTQCTSIYTGD
jgi:hypothetical protein